MKIKEIFDQESFRSWQKDDPHLRDFKNAPFQWNWPCFEEMKSTLKTNRGQRGGIHVLRGPRQVGKTTLIKKLIDEVWTADLSGPRTIFVQGDWIFDFRELDVLIRPYLLGAQPRAEWVVIDEVTFIDEWQRALKGWYDAGIGRTVHFVLTGSNAFDLMKAAELLPGRRGFGRDYVLLPMAFREYVSVIGSILSTISEKDLFFTYLKTGGFPNAIREFLQTSKMEEAEQIYLTWIRGDILKAGKSDQLLRELCSAILQTTMTPVGLDGLRERSGIGSHNTVRDYLDTLVSAFVINEVQNIDPHRWRISARKNRKYYFRDPLIQRVMMAWAGFEVMRPEGVLASFCESVVAEDFARRQIRFGYFRGQQQREVDFVSKDLCVEVKAGAQPTDDMGAIAKLTHPGRFFVSLSDLGGESTGSPGVFRLPIWKYLLRGG
jgi:predicted AAA+ superfamily ATPase